MNSNMLVVWTTLPDEAVARSIAHVLVEERLAACAQLDSPMRSIYRWEGAIQEESEIRLTLKTRRASWQPLAKRLAQLHPYSVPQIVCVDAEAAQAYADWIEDSTAG
jgi:periplasmic divalent cation tolerance protein